MKTVNQIFILLLVGFPMIMMVSCKKQSPETTNVRFNLTDAPGDYEAVYVDIKGVEVHTETEGWVMLESDLGKINLLEYMNGKTTLMAEGNISAGKITQVRLILGSDNSIIADGKTFQLQTPSAMQSGLKLNVNNTLQAGGTYEWTIDFDAAQSIVTTGSGSFILKPALRLIVDAQSTADANIGGSVDVGTDGNIGTDIGVGGGTNGSTGTSGGATGSVDISTNVVVENNAGSITGKAGVTGGLAVVYATSASGNVTSTLSASDGSFKIQSLAEGAYDVKIEPLLPLFSTKVVSNVSVKASQTTDIGFVSM